MDTPARILRLLSLLQSRPSWSGPALADRLEVTPRTLRRDVARLRELGYPVEAVPGRHGGYRLVAGGAMPPLVLEDEEAVAVAWGLRAAAGGAMPGMEEPALLALAKIEQVLPTRLQTRIREITEATVRVGGSSPSHPSIRIPVLVELAQARRESVRVRFLYRDGSGRESDRHVDPYQLVHAGRRWYLFAWDRDRADWRSFRVDRMAEVKATGMRFQPRAAPDAAGFVAEGVAVHAYRIHAVVELDVPITTARKLVPPTVAVLEEDGDRTLMRIGADEPDWLARYLAGLPCRFTVRAPDEVRHAVVELADQLRDYVGTAGSG
ncbi:MAG TPA: YafY family protein [Acidimicrobiia bacterium]|nr:YafY family protein [Acidimicrobiia bacterium]